ncbi:MAG: hypothetical protein AB7T74_07270 [Clostridia bacterium]|jgi:hypothetical protein
MPRYRNFVFALIFLGLTVFGAFCLDWPADAGLFRFGFGSQRQGFLKGVEFGLTDSVARATTDGELVFLAKDSLPGGFPVVGKAMLAVAHDSGMMSIYTGLEPASSLDALVHVRTGDVLGYSRPVTAGLGMSYYFYDAREQRFLNPVVALPALPDDRPPLFRSVVLRMDGVDTPLESNRSLKQGSYELVLDSVDTTAAGGNSPPYEIRVSIDGVERVRRVYDGAWADDGKRLLFTASPVDEASHQLEDGRILLGSFQLTRGRTVISLAALDYAGNRREVTYSMLIQ